MQSRQGWQKQNSVQESGSVCTNAGVNGILCNRLAILAPNSFVGPCRLCRGLPLVSGPASCVRLRLSLLCQAQALPLCEFGVKEDEAGVAALLDLADDGVNGGFLLDLLPYEAPEEVLGGLVFLGGSDIHKIVD